MNSGGIVWTLSRRLGMVIVFTLAFFMSAIVTIYTLIRSGNTRVPNVVGKSETEAQQMAAKAGLVVRIQRRSDDKIPENTVIETRPLPDMSVKKDSSLTIVVSSGPPQQKSEIERAPVPLAAHRLATASPAPTRVRAWVAPVPFLANLPRGMRPPDSSIGELENIHSRAL